jgi:glycosyltransferase involved in cell wall biosynthesis
MGEIVPIRDGRALADAIVRILRNRESYIKPRRQIAATFALSGTVTRYEKLFAECIESG